MKRQVVVIGSGIVGSALAAYLSEHNELAVTVLERGPSDRLLGSTGHAPGFVGLLNETAGATQLAIASAATYEQLEHRGVAGFDRVGGLEIATTDTAMTELERRAGLARDAGLPAQIMDAAQAVACAPELVDPGHCVGGVLYSHDGTARADVITSVFKERAASAGARFVYDASVLAIDVGDARVRAVQTTGEKIEADDVVIACGIWGSAVAALAGQHLPLTPVAHPYVHGPKDDRQTKSSFVRWPEHHAYARHHDDRLGLGTYDHTPLPVAVEHLGVDAERPWPAALFDPAVNKALDLLPEERRFIPDHRLNGVFSMTADNLPLLGAVKEVSGLWAAEAIWVTHAAGAAHALAQLMTGSTPSISDLDDLRPDRFTGQPSDELADRALRLYRDIYATT